MGYFLPSKEIRELQKLQNKSLEEVGKETIDRIIMDIKENVSSKKPLVSVVIIAYNEEKQILASLASLARTNCDFPVELIVVNNNSTDNTQQVLDSIEVKSVLETKQGYAHARQAGLDLALGDYILSCDADTLYQSRWVQKMIKPLVDDKDISCTYSFGSYYSDTNKYSIGLLSFQYIKYINYLMLHRKRPHLNVRGFSMGFRKSDALAIGGYKTSLKRGSDGLIGLQLASLGKLFLVRDSQAVVYTSSRGVLVDGSLSKGFIKRAKDNLSYLHNYFTPAKQE